MQLLSWSRILEWGGDVEGKELKYDSQMGSEPQRFNMDKYGVP